jgi:hypothetical protein
MTKLTSVLFLIFPIAVVAGVYIATQHSIVNFVLALR